MITQRKAHLDVVKSTQNKSVKVKLFDLGGRATLELSKSEMVLIKDGSFFENERPLRPFENLLSIIYTVNLITYPYPRILNSNSWM